MSYARTEVTAKGEQLLARVRKICMSIEGVFEKLSHGEPCWFVSEKGPSFAMFDHHHHGAEHIGVVFAAPLEAQRALVEEDPRRFLVPPYVGSKGWVTAVLTGRPAWKQIDALLRQAHAHVNLKKKLRRRSSGG